MKTLLDRVIEQYQEIGITEIINENPLEAAQVRIWIPDK